MTDLIRTIISDFLAGDNAVISPLADALDEAGDPRGRRLAALWNYFHRRHPGVIRHYVDPIITGDPYGNCPSCGSNELRRYHAHPFDCIACGWRGYQPLIPLADAARPF
mgnify:CR=1 FL=1